MNMDKYVNPLGCQIGTSRKEMTGKSMANARAVISDLGNLKGSQDKGAVNTS